MRKINKKKTSVSDDLKLSQHSIEHDAFDKQNFEDTLKHNANVKHTREEMVDDYPQIEALQQDLYSSLYKYVPELVDEARMLMPYLLNNKVMRSVVENPKYKELRTMTRLDPITSGVGLEVLGSEVKELIKELKEAFEQAKKAAEDAAKEAQEAQDAVDEAQGAADAADEGEEGKDGKGKGKSQEALTLEEAKKRLEAAKKKQAEAAKDMKENVEKPLQTNMPRALSNTIHKAREVDDLIRNWGLGSDETFGRKSYDQKLQLLEKLRNDPKLKMIAELAGRFKRLAMSAQHQKVKRGVDELYEIEMGGDLAKALPSELMRLGHPLLKWLFFKDLAEGKLLQYKYSGKEKKQRGPIIICIDES
ncbi:hypothetical protein HN682_03495, partial [Candidatus Peregrinibacteria bacterium]|nr:hypothetical protein [Candidatus Peregrinibacteria bacterium]